jgi:ribosomal protein L6P/L9E
MSRIGEQPITIPAGVTPCRLTAATVTVTGPKGELSQEIPGAIARGAGRRPEVSVSEAATTSAKPARCTGWCARW